MPLSVNINGTLMGIYQKEANFHFCCEVRALCFALDSCSINNRNSMMSSRFLSWRPRQTNQTDLMGFFLFSSFCCFNRLKWTYSLRFLRNNSTCHLRKTVAPKGTRGRKREARKKGDNLVPQSSQGWLYRESPGTFLGLSRLHFSAQHPLLAPLLSPLSHVYCEPRRTPALSKKATPSV